MKTLLFTLDYFPLKGGVANYYSNLVKYWPEPDNIFVLNNNEGQLINQKLPLVKWLPAFFALYKEIRKNKIEHVIVGQVLPLGTVTLVLSKIFKFKYSVMLHGMDFAFACRQARKKMLTEIILKNSQQIICGNSYLMGLVENEFKYLKDKMTVVNPGIEMDFVCNNEITKKLVNDFKLDGKIVLFSVGRLVRRKGFDNVIKSLPAVIKKVPNLIYVLMGLGEDEEYLKEIKNNLGAEFQDKIIFLKESDDEIKWSWLCASDIFITPSRNINGDFEGFGIVYLEANLFGLPVIAGDSGGVRDAVKSGVNGLLVDPNDLNNITDAIIKLGSDAELRKTIGKQAYDFAVKNFTWQKQAEKFYKAIK